MSFFRGNFRFPFCLNLPIISDLSHESYLQLA